MTTKLVISISGGVVTGVFSDNADIDICINDYDDAKANSESPEEFDRLEKEMEAREAALEIVY
jgi:hypothetical protein